MLHEDDVNVPSDYTYTIGAGDMLDVFVWGNDELSSKVKVRPDGKITSPLVNDLNATGKTPFELARDIEKILAKYIRDPVVSVVVTDFVGPSDKQIRVIGQIRDDNQQSQQNGNVNVRENEAVSVPYKANMRMLDLLVEIGGISPYAAGNRTRIIRTVNGKQRKVSVRLADLIEDADMSANIQLLPGDIVFIPESYF
ncbi:MAG TPA: sugar ABC transporter substrate-binding protein [Crenotrichaceae bacterium]|nr:sugar ABC transporter substrate-binding protein [Crenotrichaceae bacterium]